MSGTSGGGSNAEAAFECCCTFLGRMLVALNVDSIPGDFLPLLKIDGKCRFDNRRDIWSASCILCGNGVPKVNCQSDNADHKVPIDSLVEIEPHNVYLNLIRERIEKKESRRTYDEQPCGRQEWERMSWTFSSLLGSASRTEGTCDLQQDESCSSYDMMQDTGMALSDCCRRRTVVRRTWGTRLDKRHDSAPRRSRCDTHSVLSIRYLKILLEQPQSPTLAVPCFLEGVAVPSAALSRKTVGGMRRIGLVEKPITNPALERAC
jgi:hypothetical protein